MDYRFYTKVKEHASTGFLLYQDMRKLAPTHRIYFSQEYTETDFYCVGPLADKHFELYAMLPDSSVPVPVPTGEKNPDVAFYLSLRDEVLAGRLKRDFPKAQVVSIPSMGDDPHTDKPILARAVIRGEDIKPLKDPARPPLFYTVPVSATAWRRLIFTTHIGLGMGVIATEDWVTQLSAPVPIILHLRPGWATRTFTAPKDGYYRFSVTTPNLTLLDVDETKGVLKIYPVNFAQTTQEGSIRLKSGLHRIKVRTYFAAEIKFPDLRVVIPGQTTPVLL
jgi:hypothetical protein